MSYFKKGIVLAGGTGSRLFPLTLGISKQMAPVYDKPMIYYPLSTLMLAGIQDVLIISSPRDLGGFEKLLGDGSQWGMKFCYVEQANPEGLAQAFILASEFVGNDHVALVLGDNIFYGRGFQEILNSAASQQNGATIFGYEVRDPERYGVVEFDADGKAISLDEKPKKPRSNYAVPGLYFYDNDVVEISRGLRPSSRGELEITDVNRSYMLQGSRSVTQLSRDSAWLDTGTAEALLEASEFVRSLQHRHGLQIACLEEIGLQRGWLDIQMVEKASSLTRSSGYGIYLQKVCDNYKK